MTTIASTDGVELALHELAGGADEPLPILFLAHATGFHGRAYVPVAAALASRLHTYAPDFRGHGDTAAPAHWDVDWNGYGDDAVAVARHLLTLPGGEGGLVGFGHSKGGAALLMAALRGAPGLFRQLVLFEPIVFPQSLPAGDRPQSELPAGARRRRQVFPSPDAAIENFGSKWPMDRFDPAALEAYVRYGFREDGDGVRIKCQPEHEARTFETGGLHDTWDHLGDVEVPTVVIAGAIGGHGPATIVESIAAQLPRGQFVHQPDLDHFGPMTHPRRTAELIVHALDRVDVPRP